MMQHPPRRPAPTVDEFHSPPLKRAATPPPPRRQQTPAKASIDQVFKPSPTTTTPPSKEIDSNQQQLHHRNMSPPLEQLHPITRRKRSLPRIPATPPPSLPSTPTTPTILSQSLPESSPLSLEATTPVKQKLHRPPTISISSVNTKAAMALHTRSKSEAPSPVRLPEFRVLDRKQSRSEQIGPYSADSLGPPFLRISSIPDVILKVVLLGDSGIGKSQLLGRFIHREFAPSTPPTLGVDCLVKTLEHDGMLTKLQIWDTAGEEKYRSISSAYYRGAAGALLCFDLTNRDSFKHCKQWLKELKETDVSEAVVVLVGTKEDHKTGRSVSKLEAERFMRKNGLCKYIETSALDDVNVNEAFDALLLNIHKKKLLDLPSDGLARRISTREAQAAPLRGHSGSVISADRPVTPVRPSLSSSSLHSNSNGNSNSNSNGNSNGNGGSSSSRKSRSASFALNFERRPRDHHNRSSVIKLGFGEQSAAGKKRSNCCS